MDLYELTTKHCGPCDGQTPQVRDGLARALLAALPEWESDGRELTRTYRFANYHETMAFVNAIAWVAHRENHHPDLEVGYNRCRVRFSTHAIGGLSENDFICAAKVEALMQPR